MLKSRVTPLSSVIRKHLLPGTHSACLKATAASPRVAESDEVRPYKDMPGPRGRYAIPQIGPIFHMKPFTNFTTQSFHKLLDSLHDKYGRTIRVTLVGPSVVTEDPDAIEAIYRAEGKYPMRPPLNMFETYAERNNKEPGMALVNGPEWHRLRSASQKYMLKPSSASVYIQEQTDVANDLITRMSTMKYTPEEFRAEMFKYATESIGVVAFNKRLGFMDPKGAPMSAENKVYLESIQTFFQCLLKDIGPPLYKFMPTKLYRTFERVANQAYGYGRVQIRDVLERVNREMKEGTFDPEKPNLILQLQASPKTTDNSVDAILLDLLTGGTDSTAKNMENLLLNLALNPEKQQRLYEEILDVIGPKGHAHTADHMSNMPYFRACMKESFRVLFPLSFGSLRVLQEDVVLDGYMVPKGTHAFMNNRRLLLNSEYFDSPKEFLPERWLRDDSSNKREKEYPAFALLPFGFGHRNCLGRRFAEQELWLGVTKIIQNFHVSAPDDGDFEFMYTTFGQIKNPVNFRFVPR
ncbi:probable cytochrome P450 49a1 [Haliotis rufescens]|uniref:probable cytochrome P450 49a1 n=1 Tax=Haliotis rufescens TaxID=6454 RepID=UPI00201F4063|nr:probable cytochrome P450 49a1 [Haliotis rufescens]XP_046376462.2 probable cytochrome P450 49a1 [Haliotis rufescens]